MLLLQLDNVIQRGDNNLDMITKDVIHNFHSGYFFLMVKAFVNIFYFIFLLFNLLVVSTAEDGLETSSS